MKKTHYIHHCNPPIIIIIIVIIIIIITIVIVFLPPSGADCVLGPLVVLSATFLPQGWSYFKERAGNQVRFFKDSLSFRANALIFELSKDRYIIFIEF